MTAATPRPSDLRDSPEDLARLASTPALESALKVIGEEIVSAFDEADRRALEHQRSYRRITWWATTFGTLAILFAVAELLVESLGVPDVGEWLLIAEIASLAIAALAVLRGLFAFRHENWLLERCRAEQLRSLKFTFLLDPALWSGGERGLAGWRERLHNEVEKVRILRHDDIAVIACTEQLPPSHGMISTGLPDSVSLGALVTYYDQKRLAPQREYFMNVAAHTHGALARALPLFFFASVFLVTLHAALALAAHASGGKSFHVAGTFLAAASVAIPVVWAGIRTQQGARESARNAMRARARHSALRDLEQRLLNAKGDALEAMWTMRTAEFILEVDQREWLRLLREAEWYG